jgi:hypothetical protein
MVNSQPNVAISYILLDEFIKKLCQWISAP